MKYLGLCVCFSVCLSVYFWTFFAVRGGDGRLSGNLSERNLFFLRPPKKPQTKKHVFFQVAWRLTEGRFPFHFTILGTLGTATCFLFAPPDGQLCVSFFWLAEKLAETLLPFFATNSSHAPRNTCVSPRVRAARLRHVCSNNLPVGVPISTACTCASRTDHIVDPECGGDSTPRRTYNTFGKKKSVCDVLATSQFTSEATKNLSQSREADKLEFGAWPIYNVLRMWKMNFRREVARGSNSLTQVMLWLIEIEEAIGHE